MFTAFLMPMLSDSAINKYFVAYYQGTLNRYQGATTMALLAESMSEKTTAQRKAFIEQQQMQLPFNIALQDLDALNLTNSQLLELYQNKLVYASDNSFMYMMLAGHKQVLVVDNVNIMSDALPSEAEREGMGLMALLQLQLRRTDSQRWDELVAYKAQLFSFPIALQSVGEFSLNKQQQIKLQLGHLVAITADKMPRYGSGLDYLLQLTPDYQQVLVVGPINPPIYAWITEYQLINTLLLAIIFISLLCLWMWPTWLSSRELMVFINQQAELGAADKLKLHFGSNFNALHNTFNRMSDNIKKLFSHNQTSIQHLTRHLDQPLQEMQRELVRINANAGLLVSTEQLQTFDNSIDKIRSLSSQILLFSNVQRINSLPDMHNINLSQWLCQNYSELQLVAPNLKLEIPDAPCYAVVDSCFLGKALNQILVVINAKAINLCMIIKLQSNSTVLLIKCRPIAKELEQDLITLRKTVITPSHKSEYPIANQGEYLAMQCCAKILQLQHCQLQLQVLRGTQLSLEVIFPQYDQIIVEDNR